MNKRSGYKVLLALTVLITFSGFMTLLPSARASHPCYMGYSAHCTFTPISTVVCFSLAGLICKIRKKNFK
jgi:hypothetical protein